MKKRAGRGGGKRGRRERIVEKNERGERNKGKRALWKQDKGRRQEERKAGGGVSLGAFRRKFLLSKEKQRKEKLPLFYYKAFRHAQCYRRLGGGGGEDV